MDFTKFYLFSKINRFTILKIGEILFSIFIQYLFRGRAKIVLERLEELAEHCKHWREMIRHKREFLGTSQSNDWEDLIKYK